MLALKHGKRRGLLHDIHIFRFYVMNKQTHRFSMKKEEIHLQKMKFVYINNITFSLVITYMYSIFLNLPPLQSKPLTIMFISDKQYKHKFCDYSVNSF